MTKPYYETELGKLYCGDCFEIMPQLGPVDLVLTDPPYNCGKNYGKASDKLSDDAYEDLIKTIVDLSKNIVVVLGSQILPKWWKFLPNSKLIIVKVAAGMSSLKPKGFVPKFRPILTTIPTNIFMGDLWDDIRWPGEGYFFKERNYDHPCIAPEALMAKCVQIFATKDALIIDPFSGTGTTLVVSERFGHKWIGIEIEEKYCELAVKRIEAECKQLKLW